MDGQFQFLSFNKKIDWQNGNHWNIEVADQGLSLKQVEKHVLEKIIRFEETNLRSPVIRFSLGGLGTLFVLDQLSNLWKYDIENDYTERLFATGHNLFSTKALLAASGDTLYIADPNGPYALLAFSISNGQILWSKQDWDGQQLVPQTMTAGRDGAVYVLLAEQETAHIYVVKSSLSGHLEWMVQHHHEDRPPVSVSETGRFSMQVTHDGEVLVLDKKTRELFRYHRSGMLDTSFCVHQPRFCSGITLDSDDTIYIGNQKRLALDEEDDRFLMCFDTRGNFKSRLSAYRGRADEVLIDQQDRIFIWDEEEQSVSILALRPRTMELDRANLLSGVYISTALDSGSTEMIWHRLLVEADIPEETQLRISYFASDRKKIMLDGVYVDLDELIMAEDRTLQQVLDSLAEFWSEPVINPKDALLFHAKGRYLWLKIELVGSEQHTPRLYKMRVYFPRMSMLTYLPAVYQENERSRDFLERFLSLFGTFLFDMEEQIEQTPHYFDVAGASGPFLKWLAGWLGLSVDDNWSEEQVKELIAAAPDVYRFRGTRWALEKILEIYTGERPIIIEHFQYKHMLVMSEMLELMERLYGDNPYQFSVLVKAEHVRTKQQRLMVENILNEHKPAFTEAQLVILEPWIYMDMHTYLGVNTYLSEPSLMRLDHQSMMPTDTVLIDVDQDNRIGVHTRLALDAQLE